MSGTDDGEDLAGTVSWAELRVETERRLAAADLDGDARIEARWIVGEVTGATTSQELADVDAMLATVRGVAKLDAMVDRRLRGEPIQYVLGRWAFRELDLLIDPRVLIPRPETEVVAGQALDELDRVAPVGGVLVDLGCGSGAIGLSVVAERSPRQVVLTDIDAGALAVARANLAGLGIRGGVVDVHEGSWFAALPVELAGRIDVIVSNPPYIGRDESLPESVTRWEPEVALRADDRGLADLVHIVETAALWLHPGGSLVLEMASDQVPDIIDAAGAAGFAAEAFADLAGRQRGVVARLSGPSGAAAAAGDVDRIVTALRAGEVVLLPTDTVYGIAADPSQPDATAELFRLKDRPNGVPVALLVSSVEQARELIAFDERIEEMADAHWPGALTIVGSATEAGRRLHLGDTGGTVGVRCPDHALCRAVAERFGPIAVTSANRHGEPTFTDPDAAVAAFPDIAVAIDGGLLEGAASTVVDATMAELTVLRQGEVVIDH